MRYYEFEGRTPEEAIRIALADTQFKKEEIKIEILREGDEKRPAKIRIYVDYPEFEFIENFILGIIERMGDKGECYFSYRPPKIHINLKTKKSDNILIGKKGHVLDALEFLLYQAFKKKFPDYKVYLDINNYRKKRIEFLINKAKAICNVVRKTKKEMSFDPVDDNELKLIRNALKNENDIKTYLVKRGEEKILVIGPK
ncbi:MAG: Jag N-terminal domain-containing protein [candidate division WOR-3 bacterium]